LPPFTDPKNRLMYNVNIYPCAAVLVKFDIRMKTIFSINRD
jgi:hypothetical protein